MISYGLLFLISACTYRMSLARGWPHEPVKRICVLTLHFGLVLLVAGLSPWVLYLSGVIVNGSSPDIAKEMTPLLPFQLNSRQWSSSLRFTMVPYLFGLIAVAFVHFHWQHLRDSRLSAQVSDLRLKSLSAQLQPHFLFNALHAISELISESPGQATAMVARLGDFLRIVLESPNRPWIRVEAEAIGLDAYLTLQQMRFHDRLRVTLSVDPTAIDSMIPTSLLQPIVENAIEHGLACDARIIEVTVTLTRHLDRLAIAVTNSAPRLRETVPPTSFCDRLRHVRERLLAAYDGEANISVGPDPICGTRVELRIPVKARGLR
jgi:hypothetical protein